MKILKIALLSIIGAFTVSSCSETAEEPNYVSEPTTSNSQTLTLSEIAEINAFINSVDSLNSTYYNATRRSVDPLTKDIGKRVADGIGAKVGQRAGRWLGGTIGGAVTVNPFGAIIGYVVGDRVGGFLCGNAASAVADIMLSAPNPSPSIDVKYDLNIKTGNHKIDSLGYYHNVIVTKARNTIPIPNNVHLNVSNFQRYVYDQVLKDCYKIDPIMKDDFFLTDFGNIFTLKFKPVWDIVYHYYEYGNGSANQYYTFMNDICSVLKTNFNFDEGDLIFIKDYISQINIQLDSMSEREVHEYSFKLNGLIHSSYLDKDRKTDVSLMTMITINSKLCSM